METEFHPASWSKPSNTQRRNGGGVNERKTGAPEYFTAVQNSRKTLPPSSVFFFITSLQLAPKIGSLFLLLIKGNTLNASNDITQCIIRSDLHSHSEVTNHGAINERKKQEGLRSEHTRMPVILHSLLQSVFSYREQESSEVYIKTALRVVGAPRRAEGEEFDSVLPAFEWQMITEGCFS